MNLIFLFKTHVALQLLDIITTYYGLSIDGIHESNNIANYFFVNFGLTSGILIKVFIIILIYHYLFTIGKYSDIVSKTGIIVFNSIMLYIVITNIELIYIYM